MSIGYDWIVWTVRVFIGASALWIVYRALLCDSIRHRKGRRCPNCWYDMSGTPGVLRCSECGHTTKQEQDLKRSRRRWGLALAGCLLLVIATPLEWVPSSIRQGWIAFIPTTVLILIAPRSEDVIVAHEWTTNIPIRPTLTWSDRVYFELVKRAENDKLWAWQWRILIWRHWRDRDPPWTISILTRATWTEGEQPFASAVVSRSATNYVGLRNRSMRFRFMIDENELLYVLQPGTNQMEQPTNPWTDRFLACGTPSFDGVVDVPFVVERHARDKNEPKWQPIWDGVIGVEIARSPTADAQPVPDSDLTLTTHLQRIMTFKVDREGFYLRWSRYLPEHQVRSMPTLSMKFTLKRDGIAVASARAWWTTTKDSETSPIGPIAVPYYYRIRWDSPVSAVPKFDMRSGDWTLEVCADETLALRDVGSSTYWNDTFIVTLSWHMKDQNWIEW